MLFNPTTADVRRFFCDAWRKQQAGEMLAPIESMAVDWMLEHPEYHETLSSPQQAIEARYDVNEGRENPFLHLSMHLAIAEQLSIDQPPGLRAAFEQLARQRQSLHEAAHEIMQCLGEVVWRAQREQREPDGQAYLDCVRRRIGR